MRDIQQIVQSVIDRIYCGETVPVKKEFQNIVADGLASSKISYRVAADTTNTNRILFRRTTEHAGTVPGEV